MFQEVDRVIYAKNPLIEVVAQLQFPRVMSIGVDIPVQFQELVRKRFPIVETRRVVNITVADAGQPVTEHTKLMYDFLTADKQYKLVLGDDFIALTTSKYTRWEEFFDAISSGINALMKAYEPPFFTRVGLRYVDLIDRKGLGLAETKWSDLIKPALLGALSDEDVKQDGVRNLTCSTLLEGADALCAINSGFPNPGILPEARRDSAASGELFVIDTDFYSKEEKIDVGSALETLTKYNKYTRNAFRWAIGGPLHESLGPSQA